MAKPSSVPAKSTPSNEVERSYAITSSRAIGNQLLATVRVAHPESSKDVRSKFDVAYDDSRNELSKVLSDR